MELNGLNARICRIGEGSQAERRNVKVGMTLHTVNGQPYTKERLMGRQGWGPTAHGVEEVPRFVMLDRTGVGAEGQGLQRDSS